MACCDIAPDSWQLPGCNCMASDAANALPEESGSHSSMSKAISLRTVCDMVPNVAEAGGAVNFIANCGGKEVVR